MTRYLLDTDALIDFSKGAPPTASWIPSWIEGSDEIVVCPISVAEFYAGLTPEQASEWGRFIRSLDYWHISPAAVMRAGQHLRALRRAGRSMTTPDALLAAVALEHQATLVTGNAKDFSMEGLSLLSIR